MGLEYRGDSPAVYFLERCSTADMTFDSLGSVSNSATISDGARLTFDVEVSIAALGSRLLCVSRLVLEAQHSSL
jgi:hypothetical protein